MFLLVDDIATERQRLQDLGISLGEDIQGDYSTLAQVRDPDATRSPWRRRHRLHTRQPGDVGDLVGIGHDRTGAVGNDRTGELGQPD